MFRRQKVSLAAKSITREPLALVTRPKLELPSVVLGCVEPFAAKFQIQALRRRSLRNSEASRLK